MRLERILAALDLSPSSVLALETARRIAAPGAAIHLLHVVEAPLGLAPRSGRQVRGRLAALAGAVDPSEARVFLDVTTGSPATRILRAAAADGSGAIVLGRSRARWRSPFRPSVAEQVARVARVPVLLAHEGGIERTERVLLALDFTTTAMKVARAGIELGARLGVPVEAIHVLDPRRLRGDRDAVFNDARTGIGSLVELATGRRVPVYLQVGSPADEILAATRSTDLLVCGTARKGLLERLGKRSVSTRLLREATGTVAVVPPPLGDEGSHEPSRTPSTAAVPVASGGLP
jgi:nucleotide-binding universal stress UspA family protein